MPYLFSLDQWGQFKEDLSIYLASKKCSDVLEAIQVISQEAAAGVTLEVAYFNKREMAFGLIAFFF